MWGLLYRSQLRLHIEAEPLHGHWNAVKLAAKRSGLQGSMLLGIVMANVMHGPFASGRSQLSKERAAQRLAEEMSQDEFLELQEAMMADTTGVNSVEIPHSPEDIPGLQNVKALGPYAWASR